MSNALVCMSETVPFYNQDLCKDTQFVYEGFPAGSPNGKCPKLEKESNVQTLPQDENNYIKHNFTSCDNMTLKQTLPRKREASNILVECVKRRDNLRNIDFSSNVPCDSRDYSSSESVTEVAAVSVHPKKESDIQSDCFSADLSVNVDFSDSSIADSGIESSSPVHSVETSSISCLEEDACQNLMDIDYIESSVYKPENGFTKISCETDSLKSVNSSAADLNCLHLTEVSSPSSHGKESRPPVTQSLFNRVPSMIYFASKDEAVTAMPDHVLQTMKWKLSTITPAVIRQLVLKTGFSFVEADTTEDWIGTWGKHLKCTSFKRIKNFQKVNHYPGGFHLGRKDRLWENYSKMLNRHGSEAFNFFPETYILPADIKSLKDAWGAEGEKCWIVKPCASARGTGVKVIYKWSQVPKNRPFVVQRYISDPYLINGSKFDLRLYVMISSVEPLRVYVFEDGLVRFASEKYSLANKSFSNRFIHLTNYSINRKSSSYASNDDENLCQGHKWSLKSFWAYMSNSGIDIAKIQETITDMIIKTVISAEGPICRMAKTRAKSSYNCFELFGFDIMLDKDLHPWLLEVNISPSLHTKSMLDSNVKGPLVKDMLNIAGFEVKESVDVTADENISRNIGNRHKPLHNRWLSHEEKKKHAFYTYKHSDVKSDILENLTVDDLHCLMESEDELLRRGSFTRIFPTNSSHKYFPYFDHIRYYNVLLDAWEKSFHLKRNEGVKLLQDMSEKSFHPQNKDSTELNTKKGA